MKVGKKANISIHGKRFQSKTSHKKRFHEHLFVSLASSLLAQVAIILILIDLGHVMSLAEETSGRNLKDSLQPKRQLQTSLS